MFRKQGIMKLGLAVRTPTVYEIEETFTDDGKSFFDNGDFYSIGFSNSTKYKITTPIVLSGGASFQLGEWLVLSGDAEYTDWTQMEFNTDNPDLIEENRFIKRIFRPTTNLRGGAELTLWDLGLRLRGGVVWNPSPYKADEGSTNYDQLYFTSGVGLMVDDNTTLNIAYALGTWKTFRDNYYLSSIPNPSRTSERVNTNNVNVTLSYRF
jgi:long-subunit fatty acid transport protein